MCRERHDETGSEVQSYRQEFRTQNGSAFGEGAGHTQRIVLAVLRRGIHKVEETRDTDGQNHLHPDR